MKTFAVNSLPIHEVIQDIAKAFNTEFTESCNYFTVIIPSTIGKGKIEGIDLGNGLGIIQYQCKFAEQTTFKFVLSEVHPLKFIFCSKGSVLHSFENENDTNYHSINTFQNAIVASKQQNGHVLSFEANEAVNVFSLEISRKDFKELLTCNEKYLKEQADNLFNDIYAENKFFLGGFYSLKIAILINEINSYSEQGFQKKLFYHSKALQFLSEQIKLLENKEDSEDYSKIYGSYSVQQIKQAITEIQNNLSSPITIDTLAKEVGLNKNKLQKGFQILHGMSINSYVKSERMKHAAELISNTALSISEIAEHVGIQSKSYFSKVFKEEFNISPRDFKTKRKGK